MTKPVELPMPQGGSQTARATPRERSLRLVEEASRAEAVQSRSELLNRAVNVAIALPALILLSPLFLLIALLVKVTSKGPVFYSQTRVGIDRRAGRSIAPSHRRIQDLGGQIFTIYKFRTMCVNAEHLSGAVWAAKEDPRVTPVGGLLRKYRLDELPQLINVLSGDMNIVGPRPERPSIFMKLRKDINGYAVRQRAKPGITGLAQINQHYDSSVEDVRNKLRFDLIYLRRQGVVEDFKIMLKTVPVILFKRGGW
jgi:lipopolysaccharide/colanic/teichoic acid biosynthesis glycosyltransferase